MADNDDRAKDADNINGRLSAVEPAHSKTSKSFEDLQTLIETSKIASGCQDTDTLKRLEARVEAHDRASKRNNVVIKGLLPLIGLKDHVRQFMSEKFNYIGQIVSVSCRCSA